MGKNTRKPEYKKEYIAKQASPKRHSPEVIDFFLDHEYEIKAIVAIKHPKIYEDANYYFIAYLDAEFTFREIEEIYQTQKPVIRTKLIRFIKCCLDISNDAYEITKANNHHPIAI